MASDLPEPKNALEYFMGYPEGIALRNRLCFIFLVLVFSGIAVTKCPRIGLYVALFSVVALFIDCARIMLIGERSSEYYGSSWSLTSEWLKKLCHRALFIGYCLVFSVLSLMVLYPPG